MKERRRLGIGILALALVWCLGAPVANAASVVRYFNIQGAEQLWDWTDDGLTIPGDPVTAGTLPADMDDPAKATLYNASGGVTAEYRNYRPGYADLNTWKAGTSDALVSFNLSGTAAGTGVLPAWGETVSVLGVGFPTLAPDYDSLPNDTSPLWFAQTNGDGVPTWWCEAQANAIDKDLNGPFSSLSTTFNDFVAYTIDDAAVNPDGTVGLWIGGFATSDLAGLEAGTAPYEILEGAWLAPAMIDDDGDGYYSFQDLSVVPTGVKDCDDDDSDDPPICTTCSCGDADCAPCARCINAGATEFTGDGIDSNCNDQDDCFIATAAFGSLLEGKIDVLREFRDSVLLEHSWGRVLVDFYYGHSPAIAGFIARHDGVKVAVRTALLPVVGATWMVNAHKGTAAALAVGFFALGLLLTRRNSMKGTLVVLVACAVIAMPLIVSADESVDALLTATAEEGLSCAAVVESLIEAGSPEADVIQSAVKICGDDGEIVSSAIRAGADPFTVAYAAKGAGMDLGTLVDNLPNPEKPSFARPEPIGPTGPVFSITGAGSAWGESKFVASPSL